MKQERFDVTFIRGPRDLSPWKQASRQIELLKNSPQVEEDPVRAHAAFLEKVQNVQPDQFPNAIYHLKGRER